MQQKALNKRKRKRKKKKKKKKEKEEATPLERAKDRKLRNMAAKDPKGQRRSRREQNGKRNTLVRLPLPCQDVLKIYLDTPFPRPFSPDPSSSSFSSSFSSFSSSPGFPCPSPPSLRRANSFHSLRSLPS